MLHHNIDYNPSKGLHQQTAYGSVNLGGGSATAASVLRASEATIQGDQDSVEFRSDEEEEEEKKYSTEQVFANKQILQPLRTVESSTNHGANSRQSLQNTLQYIKKNIVSTELDMKENNVPSVQSALSPQAYYSVQQNSGTSNYSSKLSLAPSGSQYQNNSKIASCSVQELLHAQDEAQKRRAIAQSPAYQAQLCDRLNAEAQKKKQQQQQLDQQITQEAMRDCTFAPKTLTTQQEKRSFDEFLQSQRTFQKQCQEKKLLLKYHLEQQQIENQTGRPLINRNILPPASQSSASQRCLSQQSQGGAHERLYSLHNKRLQEQETNRQQCLTQAMEESTFRPNINEKSKLMIRKGRVEDNLYRDAQKRKERLDTLKSEVEQQHSQELHATRTRLACTKTDQMVASKFIKEYERILNEVVANDAEPAIDYMRLGEILRRLLFLHQHQEDLDNPAVGAERTLLYDIWHMLRGEALGAITRRNLCQFCLALIGCGALSLFCESNEKKSSSDQLSASNTQPIAGEGGEYVDTEHNEGSAAVAPPSEFDQRLQQLRTQSQRQNIGFFDEHNNWCINEGDAVYIQKHFDSLYRNRLTNEATKKQVNTSQSSNSQHLTQAAQGENGSFHPQINKNSAKLATQYREKLLEETATLIENRQISVPEGGKITHADLLLYHRKAQLHHQELRQQSEEEKRLKDCTFKPQLYKTEQAAATAQAATGATKSGTQKSLELYAMKKPASQKQDRRATDIEYEKNCDQCTFRPDLIAQKKGTGSTTEQVSTLGAKDIDKTVQRMKMARQQREAVNKMFERGYHKVLTVQKIYGAQLSDGASSKREVTTGTVQGGGGAGPNSKREPGNSQRQIVNHAPPAATLAAEDAQPTIMQITDDTVQDDQPGETQIESSQQRIPLLFVDVNLGPTTTQRIVVYEGNTSEQLAEQFAAEHGLDENMSKKLQELLESQIAGLLTRIDEEVPSINSDHDDSKR